MLSIALSGDLLASCGPLWCCREGLHTSLKPEEALICTETKSRPSTIIEVESLLFQTSVQAFSTTP